MKTLSTDSMDTIGRTASWQDSCLEQREGSSQAGQQWKLDQLSPERSHVPVSIDGSEVEELSQSFQNHLLLRGIEILKLDNVYDSHTLQTEHDTRQTSPLYLWHRRFLQPGVKLLAVETEAFSGAHAPSPPSSLRGLGLGNGHDGEGV